MIQILPISGPNPLPFQISSGNLVVRDDPELNKTVDNYELVWEAQSDNGSTSWAYTNIGEYHRQVSVTLHWDWDGTPLLFKLLRHLQVLPTFSFISVFVSF